MDILHLVYPFINWPTGLFPFFDYHESCCNEHLCISFSVYVCVKVSWWISRLYGNFIFNLLRNCQVVLQTGCIILKSHLQCVKAPICSCLCQHFFYLFSNYCHPSGCEVAFRSVDLHFTANNIAQLFTCLSAFVYLFWRKVYSSLLPVLPLNYWSSYYQVERFFFIYVLDTSPLSDIFFSNVLFYSVGCFFTFLMVFLDQKMFLILI